MILYSGMQIQNIQDVVNQLTQIIEQCEATKNKAGFFAALYKRMTVAVRDGINANQFEDGARMEKLDMIFAQRYLDAYSAYSSKQLCSHSWQFAFDCCTDNSLIVLQHLLLGINTHINLDLAIAAAEVAPGDSIHALQNDFNKINSLISSLTDDIQECLCEVWIPMRMLMKIANGKQMAVLNFSIDKAREASWASAVLLANMNTEQRNIYIQQMDGFVKILATKIKVPDIATRFMLEAIRITEYNDVARIIKLIDTTVVN
jgi:hypothetical protein